MSEELQQAKRELRERLRVAVLAMPPAVHATGSMAICAQVCRMEEWRKARTVLLFSPLPEEPDIALLREVALSSGKRVGLPRFRATTNDYEIAQVTKGDLGAFSGRFGVLEPSAQAPVIPGNQLDLSLVPGVGFGPDGSRLGRGQGFYDRLLATVSGLKFGVSFDEQMVDVLPTAPHDIRLDCILTPSCRWSDGRRVVVE